jgi:hypothetical protein
MVASKDIDKKINKSTDDRVEFRVARDGSRQTKKALDPEPEPDLSELKVSPRYTVDKEKLFSKLAPKSKEEQKLSNIEFTPKQIEHSDTVELDEQEGQEEESEPDETIEPVEPEEKVQKPQTRNKEIVVQRFDKAFMVSVGLLALLSLLFFIPLLGPLMGLSLAPYFACNRGCRHVNSKNGLQLGFMMGVLWSVIELFLLFQILNFVKIAVTEPGVHTIVDIAIIVFVFMANIIFCTIGGYTGGGKFEEANVTKRKTGRKTKRLPV